MHTRGRLGRVVRMRGFVGTIHAHAGQTEDHLWSGVFGGEPSIRTRGRLVRHTLYCEPGGTIHTHAGQTYSPYESSDSDRNHPYSRGADFYESFLVFSAKEPSIRTRGRPGPRCFAHHAPGTIHTHAGQTSCGDSCFHGGWNHPYARGADLLTRYNVRMSAKLYSVACIMQ